jgi:hypothetical protein
LLDGRSLRYTSQAMDTEAEELIWSKKWEVIQELCKWRLSQYLEPLLFLY